MVEIVYKNIDELKEFDKNPRTHSEGQVEQVAASIKEFGFTNPILIDEQNIIIAGHGRLAAAKKLGLESVPCIILAGLTEEQKKAYVIADNKLALNAGWDEELLSEIMQELDSSDFDLELTGFDMSEIEELGLLELEEGGVESSEDSEMYELPPQDKIVIKRGDIIELGEHRLMCGDSFNKDNLLKVIGDAKIDAVVTDPPYGMNLDTNFSSMGGGKDYKKVVGDDKPFDPTFFMDFFKDVKEQFWFGANYYADKLKNLALGKSSWLVWDKRLEDGLEEQYKKVAEADYSLSEFELCWSKTKHRQKILRVVWFGFAGLNLENKEANKKRFHPNQKPVRLYTKLMEEFLKAEYKNIFEPFLGSGSLLIACEEIGKRCFGLEYDPEYVQGIIQRWCDYTSIDVIKINSEEVSWSEYKESA